MKPALSLVFFTVASGAGLGLLALVGLYEVFAAGSLPRPLSWRAALLGLALVLAGLLVSLLHLARPGNVWRALARIRTSWLSREAALAVALFPVAAVYVALAARGAASGRALAALATVAIAWGVLVSTAMIYASLKPIRQWHTAWTPINFLLLGHWSGALLLVAAASAHDAVPRSLVIVAAAAGALGLVGKLACWYAIHRGAPTTLAHAIGVDQGVRGPGASPSAPARLLDVAHSGGTFLTRELGFVLARRHAGALRAIAVALGFVLPLAFLGGAKGWEGALAVAACGMMGLLVERWLFFAEARHTVRLYHGDPHT